ncbi:DUF7373 family lipoprotein [Tsukamurella pseudospumae]|uniref:Uncharacterized protein n=1 Tax=Tsukamurella pseudospumae TaxID=239498 RepID=A0A138AE04_9ACTN|nr:hypothetical protein [Tsukamurella pseudospumae]KXP08728.1 hypothetical protein AXK60_08620 [Tsukamurella pseudospumae]
MSAALVATLTGCTSTIAGTPSADPSAVSRLDTGNYPTGPREVPAHEGAHGATQGAFTLNDYLVAPFEVDAQFDQTVVMARNALPNSASLGLILGNILGPTVNPGMNYGIISAQKVTDTEPAPRAQMMTGLLRYADTSAAEQAMARVKNLPSDGRESRSPAKYPSAYEGMPAAAFGGTGMFYLQHREYLLLVSFRDVASRNTVEGLATRYFDMQLPELDRVPFTSQAGLNLPVDRDGIRRYTRDDPKDTQVGYFTARAWLSRATATSMKRARAKQELFGVDLIGSGTSNQVLRTRDSGAAAAYIRTLGDNDGWKSAGGVPGLAQSMCISTDTESAFNSGVRNVFACATARSRYVAVAQASSLTSAQQRAAAMYTALQDAK